MKTIIKITALLLLVMTSQVLTSCSSDDEEYEIETKEIYGTFKGNVIVTVQDSPDSPFHSYDTDAILTLMKNSNGKMLFSIKSTTEKTFEIQAELEALDVKGNKDYQYTSSYETEFGLASLVINSPDFNNVKVTETIYLEDGSKLSYEFNGVRNK